MLVTSPTLVGWWGVSGKVVVAFPQHLNQASFALMRK